MDNVVVDKLVTEINCVKSLRLRQDLSDQTADAKGKTAEDSKDTFGAFSLMITISQSLEKIVLRSEQILLESLKAFVRLKENNFTPA